MENHNDSEEIRSSSVYDAQLLMRYASSHGIELPSEILKSIAEAVNRSDTDTWDPDSETRFWEAFRDLAQKTKPVSVEHLKALDERHGSSTRTAKFWSVFSRTEPSRLSDAAKAEKRARFWALTALTLLMLFQVYWVIGTTLITDLEKTDKSIATHSNRLAKIQTEIELLKESIPSPQTGELANDNANNQNRSETLARRKREIEALNDEMETLNGELETNEAALSATSDFLERFNVGALFAGRLPGAVDDERNISDNPTTDSQEEASAAFVTSEFPSEVKKGVVDRLTMRFVLQILQLYVLPILYGWLGSCVYVLRALAAEIRGRSYSSITADITNRLRMYLGILAGFIVGWFFKPEFQSFDGNGGAGGSFLMFQDLSPFALAFLAGYSVELVFFTMDRLVATFTSSERDITTLTERRRRE
jgi:cell division protein FtsB